MKNEFNSIVNNLIEYGERSDNIHAMIIIGSYARQERFADKYSDIDLILVVDNPEYFIESDDWLTDIGQFHISFIEDTITGGKERRILFYNAFDVDLIPILKDASIDLIEKAKPILEQGYRVVLDKIGIVHTLPSIKEKNQSNLLFNEKEYINTVNDFWYHVIWTVKKLNRGELWTAKFCFDSYMKWKLLSMIELYSQLTNGNDYNTWYSGRFLEEWVEPWIIDRLSKCFSHYDREDMINGLLNTMDLFRDIVVEIAEKLNFKYPKESDEYTTTWIKKSYFKS